MIKVALTHDVDRTRKTYQYITHPLKYLSSMNIKGLSNQIRTLKSSNTYWGFDKIIEIEKQLNLRSTFYFLNETIPFDLFTPSNWKLSLGRYNIKNPKITNIIKYLDKNGWEIGLHGSFNSFVNIDLLKKEKEDLEEIIGHDIVGIRQHYLNLVEETWTYQKRVGFKYDTSYGFCNRIGFRENKYNPFSPFDDYFKVFPMVIMDTPFVFSKTKWNDLEQIVATSLEQNSILVINWHTNYFDENEFPNYKSDYIKILEILKKLNARFSLLKDFYSELNK